MRPRTPAIHRLRPLLAALLLLCAVPAGVAFAQDDEEIVQPKVADRKFPQSVFCPFRVDVPFVATGPTATLRFSTHTVFYQESFSGDIQWTGQYLDNITVSPLGTYTANQGALVGQFSDCYIGDPLASTLYFENAGTLPLKELFATDPTPRGWDLSNGAYFAPSTSGPNAPGTASDFSGGALGLGEDAPTPAERVLSDSAFTSVQVNGLTAGQTYVVSGWWSVTQMELDKVFMTVRVYGPNAATEVTRATFGGLKRRYR
jgi:hypothetical protein